MSDDFEKYAIYWVPRRSDALARFGSSWTGWCAEHGEPRPRGSFRKVSADVRTITRDLWRHGFHAVIKAPFELGRGRSRFSLEHIIGQFADENVLLTLPRLHLAVVEGRVALALKNGCTAMSALIVRIDEATAPLSAPSRGFADVSATVFVPKGGVAEDADPLIQMPASAAHRFHMPLTDPLGLETAFKVVEELQPILEPMLDQPRRLHELALMGDPGGGRPLRVLQRFELRDEPPRKASSALPCLGPHVLVPTVNGRLAKTDIAI